MNWKTQRNGKPLPVGLLLAALAFAANTASAAATPIVPEPAGIDPPAREMLRVVRINGVATPVPERILQLEAGELAALPESFRRWRLPLPGVAPIPHKGRSYLPLRAVTNLSFQLDKRTGDLLLEGAPYVFLPDEPDDSPARLPDLVPRSAGEAVDHDATSADATDTAPPDLHTAGSAAPRAPSECGPGVASPELLLDVRINGVDTGVCEHVLRLGDGRLAATAQAFRRWRIHLPMAKPIAYQEEEYFPLDAVEGLSYHVDAAAQVLMIEGRPEAFLSSAISGTTGALVQPAPSSPGGFFNYDLSSLISQGNADSSALLELGVFNRLGVGTGTFLWRDFGEQTGLTRLETTWTQDRPDAMRRLRFGDAIGRAGAWGRSVRFGGVQWGTSFDTQPGFIPFPLPGTTGEAVLPSTVDVYVNNALRLSREVPSGPFGITNVPVVTGQGEVRLVVTDLLGRQQVITQPYYASPNLLRAGLADYTYEIGFVREDFGLADNEYGRFLGTATHRLGITDRLTRELRAEILADRQTAGLTGVYLWPAFGVGNASVALSRSASGGGGLIALGVQRQTRALSFSLQGQFNSREFAQLGLDDSARRRQTLSASIGFSPGGRDALSLSYLRQTFWEQTGHRVLTVGYSRNLGSGFHLSIFGLHSVSDSTTRSIGVTVTRPLGPRTSASAGFTQQTAGDSATAQIQQNLPAGPGFGYRLLTETGPNARSQASGSWQTDVGTYTAEASEFGGATSYRLGASGGLAFLGGGIFPSRRINDSFAVARTGGYPDVRVYAENQFVARTDSRGLAMIPRLLPYQANSVSIEQADLPLDARVDTLRLQVTPYLRSGALADFPVGPSRGGTVTIRLADGAYVPPGAVVRIVGRAEEYPVAYRGEAYLTGLAETNDLLVSWNGQECRLRVGWPKDAGPLPNLGTFVCDGIRP